MVQSGPGGRSESGAPLLLPSRAGRERPTGRSEGRGGPRPLSPEPGVVAGRPEVVGRVFENPVVRGTNPDPSVVRVGEDYYLATSSFGLLPGIVLRHSRNLVDWRIIGAAVTRPAQYRRDGRIGPVELFAPTLRHHRGCFYLVCTNIADDQGNFLLTATDPAGEWSDAVWLDREGFDPSLLFADGTCYYTRRSMSRAPDGSPLLGPIVQAELDVSTGELGDLRPISPASGGFCSNDIEGPHVYAIGGWYYLFSAEGGSWTGHMQTCARSRSPWGPFEPAPHNPVLTHRHRVGHAIQTVGHADLVDAPDGTWWAVCLGTRHEANHGFVPHHNLGRETFLAPVRWTEEGWPVVGQDGTIERTMIGPRFGGAADDVGPAARSLLDAGWRTIGLPAVDLDDEGPAIALPFGAAADPAADLSGGIGALLQPQTEDDQVFVATLESVDDGGAAGVGVLSDSAHRFEALVRRGGDGSLVGEFRRTVDDVVTREDVDLPADLPLIFAVTATPVEYRFSVAPLGGSGTVIGSGRARLLSAQAAEWFVGAHFALLALAVADPARDGRAVFGGVEVRRHGGTTGDDLGD